MYRAFALLLVVVCATASAEVFRWIGPDGEVYFSDTPRSGAERVELSPAQSMQLRAIPRQSAGAVAAAEKGAQGENAAAPSYAQFTIVKPSNDQGVRANNGSVTVYLSLQPALMPGHMIELTVDGEDGEKIRTGDTLNFNLENMSRGRHTVSARVVNEQGQVLIRTGPLGFYVLRVALGGRRPR